MINYRHEKRRYRPNQLGSLYIDETKLDPNEQPIIYIGGQMEHRCHVLEQTGFTADDNHNMFTGSWFYDYPISSQNKADFNGINFAKNLLLALQDANLRNVILITESYGGTIASYLTRADIVDKVIAIHPSILGTPLANPEYLEEYKHLFNKRQLAILKALKKIVNIEFGFEQDNFRGIDMRKVNIDKLLVVGSSINPATEQNPIIKETSEMIEIVTSSKNDGVVLFEESEFQRLGINYLKEDENVNHLQAGTKKHVTKVYQKVLK